MVAARGVDRVGPAAYLAPLSAPSSNGKTTDSDSVNRGSNPRGASSFLRNGAFASCTGARAAATIASAAFTWGRGRWRIV